MGSSVHEVEVRVQNPNINECSSTHLFLFNCFIDLFDFEDPSDKIENDSAHSTQLGRRISHINCDGRIIKL